MQIPNLVSKATVKGLAAADESHAMRVILHDVNNSGPARLRVRQRIYVFERCARENRHVLEIPASVWMDGAVAGRHRENRSVSAEFATIKNANMAYQIVSWGEHSCEDELAADDIQDASGVALDPEKGEILDLLEKAIITVAHAHDPEKAATLTARHGLQSQFESAGQERATEIFRAAGRQAILAFQDDMWPELPDEDDEGDDEADKSDAPTDAPEAPESGDKPAPEVVEVPVITDDAPKAQDEPVLPQADAQPKPAADGAKSKPATKTAAKKTAKTASPSNPAPDA